MWISLTADEKRVFKRFIGTQPNLSRRRWRYDGAHHKRPDFVLLKDRIGVELAEWLHEKQTAAARELDRFQKEINQTARRRRLSAFTNSVKPSSNTRYTVLLMVKRVPPEHNKVPVITALLDFLRTAKKPESDRERKSGVGFGPAELPEKLKPFWSFIRIKEVTFSVNPGIVINRSSSYDSNVAVKALLDVI